MQVSLLFLFRQILVNNEIKRYRNTATTLASNGSESTKAMQAGTKNISFS